MGGDDGEAYPRDSSFGKRAGWVLEVMHTLRGVGWNWSCVPRRLRAPVTSRSKWILTRLLRGAAIWLWLDFLVFYVRTLDRNFFVPEGHATGFSPPADGVPYPSLFSISTKPLLSYPPPLGFPPMPPTPSWKRTAYQLLLHVLRTVLGASAMFTTISGMYTFVALVFVLLGCVLGTSAGWRARWLSPNAWPDAFGHILGGDYGHGVRGYWGRGWHSLFRSIFTAPGDGLVARLSLPPHSLAAKIIALTLPFVFSGALHFAGCWTQSLGGWGAVQFFLLQPLGIVLESYCCCFRPRPRGAVAKVLMYLWALAWFAATATPFFEDYRWGGLWVVEPIPVSVIRWRADLWMSQPGERGWGRWADGGGYGVVLG
ncbi:hypothetical protein FN846DRAFT_498471 [Sphaerosporella brunnea]|uniref:Wax synthase domain-containing protein n=1 Tax=Sphaerosporella brunnea TaxID=1250544 RepID=A0A5J5EET9_9PEZI|nr:hypothetical protein FN846DRAFT_498471 [Sphaerosporella brunnea]